MRTKKVLSILLALLMTMGVFAIGASANELAGEEADLQTVPTVAAGWDAVIDNGIWLGKAGGSIASATIGWNCFGNEIASGTSVANTNYNYYYGLTGTNKASFSWEVYRFSKNAAGTWVKNTNPETVHATPTLATSSNGIYWAKTDAQVLLYLNATIANSTYPAYYGPVEVRLTVTVPGKTTENKTSAVFALELINPTEFGKLIEKAEEILKEDRYTKAYADNLKAGLAAAKIAINSNLTQTELDREMGYLQNCIDGKKANGDPVGEGKRWKYKLTFDFLDNLLGDGVIEVIYKIIDFFNAAMSVINPMIEFFGKVGSAIGFLIPLFTFFFGLIGL